MREKDCLPAKDGEKFGIPGTQTSRLEDFENLANTNEND